MTDRPYKDFAVADLWREQEETKAAAAMCKNTLAEIEVELADRFGADVADKLQGASGSWAHDAKGYIISAKCDKDVKWESDALLALALSMPLKEALPIFDIDVKIKERTYANLTGRLREQAELARTVAAKRARYTIEKK